MQTHLGVGDGGHNGFLQRRFGLGRLVQTGQGFGLEEEQFVVAHQQCGADLSVEEDGHVVVILDRGGGAVLGHEEGRVIGALDLYRDALRAFRQVVLPDAEEAAQARVFTLDELVAVALAGGQSVTAPLEAEERVEVVGIVDGVGGLIVDALKRFVDVLEHLLEVGLAILRAG